MKIWHDDIRKPPGDYVTYPEYTAIPEPLRGEIRQSDRWIWCRTNGQAKAALDFDLPFITGISIDHDLGLDDMDPDTEDADYLIGHGEETGAELAAWMVEKNRMPPKIAIHSMNPAGALRIMRYFQDWKGVHEVTVAVLPFDRELPEWMHLPA